MNTVPTSTPGIRAAEKLAWKEMVAKYQKPSTPRAVWQIIDTLVPYGLIWYFMYRSLSVSWFLTIPLAALAGAFLIRIFIIFHDCGHGSFFESRRANDIVGFVAGVLTFTPYYHCDGSTTFTMPALVTWTNGALGMCGP